MHICTQQYTEAYLLHVSLKFTVPLFGRKLGLWQIIAVITLPIAVVKQFISLLILKVACQSIAAIDVKERENKRMKT